MKKKAQYVLYPEKPILIVEVYLPKKMEYMPKLSTVLESFLDVDVLRRVPLVQNALAINRTIQGFSEPKFLSEIHEVISGYSIYEVDGRYGGTLGPTDERVLVIRFLIQDPVFAEQLSVEVINVAENAIRYLITQRFAEEIGYEDEIWFVKYPNCILEKWIKTELSGNQKGKTGSGS